MKVRSDLRAAIGPAELLQIARRTAGHSRLWRDQVRFATDQRWYSRLAQGDDHEVWLLTWLPGQRTGYHDHGESAGAFVVASGCLAELAACGGRPEPAGRTLRAGDARSFGSHYVHDVRNDSMTPAVSIHAYSPALTSMRRFEVAEDGLLRVIAEDRSW